MSTEDDLYDMSDEELMAAFKEAKMSDDSEIGNEEEYDTGVAQEEDATLDNEFGNDLEQSTDNEDSDHDSDEGAEVASSEEETTDTDEDNSDGNSEAEEDDTTEDDDTKEESEQEVQSYKFKANGQEYEFKPEEIMEQFPRIFGQAMDYTKKMQAIKPWRKTIDALEEAKLQHNDINLMIDVLNGDKAAIAEVLKRTGVDALDLNTDESNYAPKDYGRNESELAMKEVIDLISKDEAFNTTQHILANQWDERSWEEMTKNPDMIRLLHVDVQNGMYDTIAPKANKLKVYDGGKKSDLDYYIDAARQHFGELSRLEVQQQERQAQQAEAARIQSVKAAEAKRQTTKQEASRRKAAAPTTNSVAKPRVVDYLDDSDEAFDEWYKKLQDDI